MKYKLAWLVFIATLLIATVFVSRTSSELPPLVASHFDAAGNATSYMAVRAYRKFIWFLVIGLPLALVVLTTLVYSRVSNLKLPNRDYWLASQRIERTRAFLILHGVWFGSLLVSFMCFMHWLSVEANRVQPPHLSNEHFLFGLFLLFGAMLLWIAALSLAFRRPRAAD